MSETPDRAETGAPILPEGSHGAYWPVPLLRAAGALVAGLIVTFSTAHSAPMGFWALAGVALVAGVAQIALALGLTGAFRALLLAQGAVLLLAAVAAGLLSLTGTAVLVVLVIAVAAVTGLLELIAGLRARGRAAVARDWIGAGAITMLFALAALLVQPGYAQPWQVVDKETDQLVTGVLTGEIVIVGVVGAYAVVLGLFLLIAGISARWEHRRAVRAIVSGAPA